MPRTPGQLLRTPHLALAATLVALPCLLVSVSGQAPAASPQDRAAALKQSLAANKTALRQYSWVETTQISLKGEVKKQEQKQCSYGADGKVQKTPIAGAAPEKPAASSGGGGRRGGGRLKEAIVENKVDDMKEYLAKVAALVQEYVPPDAQKIQAAQAAGNVTAKAGTLVVKNYLKEGDSLSIGLDTAAKKLSSYNVASYVEKPKDDPVSLAVTFALLPDGTSYPQQVLLDVKSKNLQVKITNSGYKKPGQ
jgi:hypothetical protein